MSTDPAGDGLPLTEPRAITAASDMNCLPAQGKVQRECRARSRIAFHSNFPRVLLDDSVRDREPQPRATVLAFLGSRLGREEWIVNALNVFRRDARAGVRHPHAHHVAVRRGYI